MFLLFAMNNYRPDYTLAKKKPLMKKKIWNKINNVYMYIKLLRLLTSS